MSDITFANEPPELVNWGVASCEIGPLLLGFTQHKQLCRLSFLQKAKPPTLVHQWQKEWPQCRFTEDHKSHRLSAKTPLLLVGTDFQHRVWAALLDIPEGETVTYGELATHIGKPKAARAVGTALGANPIPYLIPCHRVVAAQGLGGYMGGLKLKQLILASENHR